MSQRRITMQYYSEPEGWWAASEDLPGFSAAGATFEQVQKRAHSGAEFFAEEPLEVIDYVPGDSTDIARNEELVAAPSVDVQPSPWSEATSQTAAVGVITTLRYSLGPSSASRYTLVTPATG